MRQRVLCQADQFDAALDLDPLLSDGFAQEAFGFGLGDEPQVVVAAAHMPEIQPEDPLAAAVYAAPAPRIAQAQHLVGRSALLQEFQRALRHAEGPRGGRRIGGLVNQPHRDAEARQLQGRGKASRAGSYDQYRISHDCFLSVGLPSLR